MADRDNGVFIGALPGTEPLVIDETLPVAVATDPDVIDEEGAVDGDLPPRAQRNGDGSVTLPLRKVVAVKVRRSSGEVSETRYPALTFHRLTGGDMRAITAASRDATIIVAMARSARIREAVMNGLYDQMDGADIADCGDVIAHFLGSGRKTGR